VQEAHRHRQAGTSQPDRVCGETGAGPSTDPSWRDRARGAERRVCPKQAAGPHHKRPGNASNRHSV
jgi:hypothetical protein